MSRSKRKGSKGYGWEYWGKRPLKGVKGDRGSGGTKNKRHGIQRERAISKSQLRRLKIQLGVEDEEGSSNKTEE